MYFFSLSRSFSVLAHSLLIQGAEHLKSPLYIIVSRASQSAIEAIEERGGKIVCKYYNALALRDCLEGRIDRISAAPTRREDISKLELAPETPLAHCVLQYSTVTTGIVVSYRQKPWRS